MGPSAVRRENVSPGLTQRVRDLFGAHNQIGGADRVIGVRRLDLRDYFFNTKCFSIGGGECCRYGGWGDLNGPVFTSSCSAMLAASAASSIDSVLRGVMVGVV